ncbi:hypothetical protein BLNAU_5335 [Blattamonas nauphoetae]|uniref:Uncharacterized protein n=1 Tax=Blattamonas nauphoetae TaxID=2049346 RepID=A0ABQ9Y750_9EUKA|nr:hypothetical protein BLNAU_5335 [Blattamonas nauphoetae]
MLENQPGENLKCCWKDRVFPDTSTSFVVSSGETGLLPADSYIHRKWALNPVSASIASALALSDDWNTTRIVLSGTNLLVGSYWMLVEEEDYTFNISLTFFEGNLGTTVPLHPSTADVTLKCSTQYKVTKVTWFYPGEETAKEVELKNTITFTTPPESTPPVSSLTSASAHILKSDQQYAFVLLRFDREVSGSYEIVVEEEGKDVTFTVVVAAPETTAETEGFVVVGDDRILTHDTTYQIKSLSPTPGTESTTTPVGMSDPITFHIPKSSFVPPIARGVVVVARGGSDSMDECGGDDLPCRTVWTGQMCGKGKGGEWMWVLVRGEAEMGEGFEIEGSVGMTLSSESSTRRSRVVIGDSSFSSSDGIVSISSARVEAKDLNVILPSSEERSSSGWVFVVESEGTLEADSIGLSGEGQIGVGLAKVKSGTGRFDSVSMSSESFGGVGVIVGEGKWNQISMFISDLVVRDATASNAPLIAFSSLSPLSTFSMEGSRFQKTRRVIRSSSSEGDGVIEVSTAQSRTEISNCVFVTSGVVVGTETITRSALHVTLDSSSASSRSLVISSSSLHIQVLSGHAKIVFEDSWFETTTSTRVWTRFESGIACLDWTRRAVNSSSSTLIGALIEYSDS